MTLRWKIAQWFELRWWVNYLRGKDKAEYLSWKKNYWNNLLAKIPEIKMGPSKTIADLGCGPAGVFIVLPKNKITAIDPLLNDYESRVPFFAKSDYPNTTFICCTIEAFQPAEKSDIVFCMNAINHLHDMKKGFDKLKEVCKTDGTIIISIDAHNFSFFKYLFRLIPGDILHPHQYDLKEYQDFLSDGDCKISSTQLLKHEFFFDHYLLVAVKSVL
ncbi:MAG: Methyltransferase type 11 [Bacteroidota bacterium]|nr:Methyltransferase type 11 [Bacteroidota bacterium]